MYLAKPLAEPNAEQINRFEQLFQPKIARPSDEGIQAVGREQAYCSVTGKSLQEKLGMDSDQNISQQFLNTRMICATKSVPNEMTHVYERYIDKIFDLLPLDVASYLG